MNIVPILYEGAKFVNSQCGEAVSIGECSYVWNSLLKKHVEINRRNMIVDSVIGEYTYTGSNTTIKKAEIGKFCSISWNVSITGNMHEYTHLSTHPFITFKKFGFVEENDELVSEKIHVGNDVWIGMNVCVLPGVKIGNGAVIGAGSVVTKDVPAYAIVAGNPAKIIKYRFSDLVIEQLQKICWWDWSVDVIKENVSLFEGKFSEEQLMQMLRVVDKESKTY